MRQVVRRADDDRGLEAAHGWVAAIDGPVSSTDEIDCLPFRESAPARRTLALSVVGAAVVLVRDVADTKLEASSRKTLTGGTGGGAPEEKQVAGAPRMVAGTARMVASTEKMVATSNKIVATTEIGIARPKTFAVTSEIDDAPAKRIE